MAITRKDEAEYSHWRPEEVQIIEGRAVRFRDICVHEFSIGDVEDPGLSAGELLWNWQQSDAGQWVMTNAAGEPYWTRGMDHNTWGYRYKIMARLSEPNIVFYQLKFGSN